MDHDPSIHIRPTGPADANQPSRAPQKSDGAAFRALLERLEERTRSLREEGAALKDPAALAGAVDRARESIDEAVSLGEELLEAYRAARQRAETGTEAGPKAGPESGPETGGEGKR